MLGGVTVQVAEQDNLVLLGEHLEMLLRGADRRMVLLAWVEPASI
jgi:hypothetical protein